MTTVKNPILNQLFDELRFAPREQRTRQLEAAEQLLGIIEGDKEYPFEFVCFRITDYRLNTAIEQEVIRGDELAGDLEAFIRQLSGQLALPAADQPEEIYTVQQLTRRFCVSKKNISRWQNRGLRGWIYLFADGRKRLGFRHSAVERFTRANHDKTAQAAEFTQLNRREKDRIIDLAAALVETSRTRQSRHQVIREIAAETGRAVETIRYTLRNYERANPDRRIFHKPAGVVSPRDAAQVYKLYNKGAGIKDLMDKFNRSRSSIYRIINVRRAKELLSKKIEYVDSSEFLTDGVQAEILPEGQHVSGSTRGKSAGGLLNREQEIELFRRYNYLKYLACLERAKIRPNYQSRQLKLVEEYIAGSEEVKKTIIESNLRLVISIASKHLATGAGLSDLISEGNFSLMRAVEKFDYTRGYRFSTYATWAIAKDFARRIPAEAARPDRGASADLSNIQQDWRLPDITDFAAIERAHRSLEHVIKDNLTEREQFIVRNHFALDGGPIKRKGKSLKQIGDELNLSKERVRQIELEALQKLRHNLSPEEFDLLTG